jgi:hypothetical protein
MWSANVERPGHTAWPEFGTSNLGAIVRLQIDPALRVRAKEGPQAQCRVYRDAPQAFHDFVDAPRRHVNGPRQGVLADSHGLQPVLQQDGAGVGKRNLSMRHGETPFHGQW